ncbi:hypothetical protein Anapl_00742 [Anas platyrhynchos]|uniref:Uncharacterized protein n=1 Tax=Anas platyrhynchos TaxID=8839 RepID=R0LJB0_ANAPL|nr:hypothetical protein Anapl_00742 [Anas platyrhynchos]
MEYHTLGTTLSFYFCKTLPEQSLSAHAKYSNTCSMIQDICVESVDRNCGTITWKTSSPLNGNIVDEIDHLLQQKPS